MPFWWCRLEGVGYDFLIGLSEWILFAPIAIGLGLGCIAFHAVLPTASAVSALLITFFFVALPEEHYFRGLLQNLLKKRIGHPWSHFWLPQSSASPTSTRPYPSTGAMSYWPP